MELQRLTEELLQTVTSLNRSCIPQSVQEPLKGENFLLDYLSAQNGCSTPGALREVLGVSAPRTGVRPHVNRADAHHAACACAVRFGAAGRAGFPRADSPAGPHHGDRGGHLTEQVRVCMDKETDL